MDVVSILSTVDSIRGAASGARFYNVDLHVHSPGSFDFAQGLPNKNDLMQMGAKGFLGAWADRGFDLIAITDHNTGTFIDEALHASKELAKDGKHIAVLPGVELTVDAGAHVLAIFPETATTASVNELLVALGMSAADQNKPTSLVKRHLSEVCDEVRLRGGILIAAHCNSDNGMVRILTGQPRLDALRYVDALENSTQGSTKEKTIAFVTTSLGIKNLPFVCGSDSHDPNQLTDGMWVKMASPDFNSLRQFLFEPGLRLRDLLPHDVAHPRIVGCATTSGIYAATTFGFSPNLNVLIGGRGAGKSALIDIIRFALEAEPSEVADLDRFKKRIRDFLLGTAEVVILVSVDGDDYAIVRSGAFTLAKNIPVFSSDAAVFAVHGASVVPTELRPRDLFPVEFYGQGEVAILTKSVSEQLSLVDENLDLAILNQIIDANEQGAVALEAEIVQLIEGIEGLDAQIADLPGLKTRRDDLKTHLSEPVFEKRTAWVNEKVFVDAAINAAKSFAAQLPSDVPFPTLTSVDMTNTPNGSTIQQLSAALWALRTDLNQRFKADREAHSTLRATLDSAVASWQILYDAEEQAFNAQLHALNLSTLGQLAVQLQNTEGRIKILEEVTTPQRNDVLVSLGEKRTARAERLEALFKTRKQVEVLRQTFIDKLNSELGGVVNIELSKDGNTDDYFEFLDDALDGSGIQNRQTQLGNLCKALSPGTLCALLRNKDLTVLQQAGLTAGARDAIVQHMDEALLLRLERIECTRMPIIQLRRENETTYTDLEHLSVGEQCSAILSIALVAKTKPLIVDQPEDELDHAFVTLSIVEKLRQAKASRQVITATHNPNIPVLGDAEMVFRLGHRAGAHLCEVRECGGIEEPAITREVQMLEGGAEAFEKRAKRYAAHSQSKPA